MDIIRLWMILSSGIYRCQISPLENRSVKSLKRRAGGSAVIEHVKEAAPGVGFNALTEEYADMVKAGIVDPLKVTRSALQNAASIASMPYH